MTAHKHAALMLQYEQRIMTIAVMPVGQPTFSELTTNVSIDDECAGEFVIVEQSGRTDIGKIAICPDEWPTLRAAIDQMISECRSGDGAE